MLADAEQLYGDPLTGAHALVVLLAAAAPFRNMVTPGGYAMSVAMTNCGAVGWVTDRKGYRYSAIDPESGRAWPALPASFLEFVFQESVFSRQGVDRILKFAFELAQFWFKHANDRELAQADTSAALRELDALRASNKLPKP